MGLVATSNTPFRHYWSMVPSPDRRDTCPASNYPSNVGLGIIRHSPLRRRFAYNRACSRVDSLGRLAGSGVGDAVDPIFLFLAFGIPQRNPSGDHLRQDFRSILI
jgi:hypothetical protein